MRADVGECFHNSIRGGIGGEGFDGVGRGGSEALSEGVEVLGVAGEEGDCEITVGWVGEYARDACP